MIAMCRLKPNNFFPTFQQIVNFTCRFKKLWLSKPYLHLDLYACETDGRIMFADFLFETNTGIGVIMMVLHAWKH